MTPARTIGRRNISPSTGKRKITPERSASSPCRWTGLKKNLRRLLDQDTKTSLLQSLSKSRACASGREREKKLSVRIAAGLLGLNRTSIYYKHRSTGTINLLKRNLRARLSSTESTQITPPGAPVSFQSSCGCRDSKPAASEPCGLCVKWASMLSTQR